MKKSNAVVMLLVGAISVVGLTGCEQVEQAATDAVEKARQSALQVLDEAKQSGSIDQARQSANQALNEAKQKAAGLLGQASEYLSQDQQEQDIKGPPEGNPATAL